MKKQVRYGLGVLDKLMTKEQALRFAQRNMPSDLKRAGFKAHIFTAERSINGWDGYRINYGKEI